MPETQHFMNSFKFRSKHRWHRNPSQKWSKSVTNLSSTNNSKGHHSTRCKILHKNCVSLFFVPYFNPIFFAQFPPPDTAHYIMFSVYTFVHIFFLRCLPAFFNMFCLFVFGRELCETPCSARSSAGRRPTVAHRLTSPSGLSGNHIEDFVAFFRYPSRLRRICAAIRCHQLSQK